MTVKDFVEKMRGISGEHCQSAYFSLIDQIEEDPLNLDIKYVGCDPQGDICEEDLDWMCKHVGERKPFVWVLGVEVSFDICVECIRNMPEEEVDRILSYCLMN